jgi:hypothetical protein
LAGPALAAPAHPPAAPRPAAHRASALAWVVTPTDSGCRTDLELTSRSGAVTPITLTSDGQLVSMRFFKDDLPARAFLPLRVDKARYSNLMLRGADGSGELVLSEETEAAMKKGGTLGVAWLTDEPLSAPLAGSEQGLADLRVCGAQTASRYREKVASEQAAKERAASEARAKTLADAQLAAVKAQTAAADAQRRQAEETAERQRRADADARAQAVEQARLEQERSDQVAQQRAYDDERRRAYQPPSDDEDDTQDAPPPPVRYWPAPRWRYPRY